jgi:tetratricopeptide (TPR) repeat protein
LYATLNEDEKANHYFKSALLLAERLKNPGLQAEVSTRSGRVALKQEKYIEAQRFFEHSNAIQSSIKIDNEQAIRLINQSISENYCDIARVFEAQKDEAKVRAYYKLAYEHDIPYHNWMGMLNYAQFLQSRGDYKGARPIYEKSLTNLKTIADMPKYFEDLLQNRLRRLPNIKGDPAVDALVEEGRKRVSEKNIDIARATFQKAIDAAVEKFGRDSIESAQKLQNVLR